MAAAKRIVCLNALRRSLSRLYYRQDIWISCAWSRASVTRRHVWHSQFRKSLRPPACAKRLQTFHILDVVRSNPAPSHFPRL